MKDTVSESSRESSGYESETVRSEATSAEGEDGGGDDSGAHRRMRMKFTSDQIYKLENTFNRNKYLGTSERLKVAAKLHLSETQHFNYPVQQLALPPRSPDNLATHRLYPSLMQQMAFPQSPLHHLLLASDTEDCTAKLYRSPYLRAI
ncbi:UNVERIFIED_CONTAM: hypothetical protein FKN15_059025 [Acipenser sinensis]